MNYSDRSATSWNYPYLYTALQVTMPKRSEVLPLFVNGWQSVFSFVLSASWIIIHLKKWSGTLYGAPRQNITTLQYGQDRIAWKYGSPKSLYSLFVPAPSWLLWSATVRLWYICMSVQLPKGCRSLWNYLKLRCFIASLIRTAQSMKRVGVCSLACNCKQHAYKNSHDLQHTMGPCQGQTDHHWSVITIIGRLSNDI